MTKLPKSTKRFSEGHVVYAKPKMPTRTRIKVTDDIIGLGQYYSRDDFARLLLEYSTVNELKFILISLRARQGLK
jgi:hypothetical protein